MKHLSAVPEAAVASCGRRFRTTSTWSCCARSRRIRATATRAPRRWTPTSRASPRACRSSHETEDAATAVLAGAGLMPRRRPRDRAPRPRRRPAGAARRTPPAGYYGYEEPPRGAAGLAVAARRCCSSSPPRSRPGSPTRRSRTSSNANKPVPVPLVEGSREPLAMTKISDAGLVPRVDARVEPDRRARGRDRPEPGAGRAAARRATRSRSSSRPGSRRSNVPAVVGKTRDDAVGTLAMLASGGHGRPGALGQAGGNGHRRRTRRAGETVVQGTRVRINVSSGPAAGRRALRDRPALRPGERGAAERGLRRQAHGRRERPAGGHRRRPEPERDRAAPGATITLSVSKGPKTSSVPDVTSQDEQSARDTLTSAGFKVQVQRQDVTDPGLDGIVLDQSPTGGTQAKQGTTVDDHGRAARSQTPNRHDRRTP